MNDIRASMKIHCSSFSRMVLRFVMLSLFEDEAFIYNSFSLAIIALSWTYPINNIWFFIYHANSFDLKCNTLSHILGSIVTNFKVLLIRCNRKHLNNVINRTVDLQKKTNTEEWSQNSVYNINRIIALFTMTISGGMAMFSIQCLIGRIIYKDSSKWSLPFSDVAFINRTYSPNYEIAWLYQTTCITFMGIPYFVTDFLILGIIADLIVQFKLIRKRITLTIEEGMQLSKDQNCKDAAWICLKKSLNKIVVDHIILLDLVTDLEKVSNILLLIDVLGYLMVMCFLVYYASVLPLISFKSFQIYLELFGVIICLFLICYCGTQLSELSQSVGTACYECDFWETDIKFQNGLRLIILRSQKPITITVGKFITLSINVFAWIMKTTYTLSLILHKTNEKINE